VSRGPTVSLKARRPSGRKVHVDEKFEAH
jgi:hypothetical protein